MNKLRCEHDTMGDVYVDATRYWGAQTQRSFDNFKIGRDRIPEEVIQAFAVLKMAAASANRKLGVLDDERASLIITVCQEILDRKLDDNFPLCVYQTGSGTQSNMNVNEVIANRGNEIAGKVLLHPNDHVNKSQSSNDTFPTAMHIAALKAVEDNLLPSLADMSDQLKELEEKYSRVVKVGRTHLQDATPITLGQEISGWRSMIDHDMEMIASSTCFLRELALGGTAVGTGLNAPSGFAETVAEEIARITEKPFITAPNKFYSLTSKGAVSFVHGALRTLAADFLKMANDVRLLSSGPRCGIGELIIPANEPGSSIMPGKVNPTQCEAMTMVCVQVMGNDTTISMAASQGNFELNVFMPVIINDFLESVRLLSDGCNSFRKNCISGLRPDYERIKENLNKSLMNVTALNPHIGYENAAKIAKKAYADGTGLRDAAIELKLLDGDTFDRIVNPEKMV